MADFVTRIILDNKQFDDNIEKSKKQIENYANIQKNVLGTMGKFAGVIGLAGGAMASFDKLIHSSQTTSDAWDKTIGTAKTSVDAFFTSLSTGDFSSFYQGLDGMIIKSQSAIAALDQLGNTAMSFNLQNARLTADIANAREIATNKDLSKSERKIGLTDWDKALKEQEKAVKNYQNRIIDALQKKLVVGNNLTAKNISIEDVRYIAELDNKDYSDEKKEELKRQYEEYLKQAKEINKQISNINSGYREGGISKTDRDNDIKALKQKQNVFAESKKEAIIYNELLVKLSDEELQNLDNEIIKVDNLTTALANAQKEFNLVTHKVNSGSDSNGKTVEIISSGSIAELDKKLTDLRKQFLNATSDELRTKLNKDIEYFENKKITLTFQAKYPNFDETTPQMAGIIGSGQKGTKKSLEKANDLKNIKLPLIKPVISKQDVQMSSEYIDNLNMMSSALGNLTIFISKR
jgi:hypothetical protein